MPIIQVTLTQGRTPQTIRSMISKVTDAVAEAGVAPRENVRVLVNEIPAEHFAAGDTTIAERQAQQVSAASSAAEGQS